MLAAMATIRVDGEDLSVELETNEKLWGLLSDLRVPLTSVVAVESVPDGRRATHGLRAPGLGGTQRLIGTWRAKGDTQYVCVRRAQPAVKVTLQDERYRTVLIGADGADEVAQSIRAAL